MWLGRKGCSLNGMQKESANPRYSLPARISSGLLKACSMSVKMKGGWGDRQLERQVHLSPGEKSPCVLWGASSPGAAGGRGGLGMAGNGTRLGSSLCTVLLFSAQN